MARCSFFRLLFEQTDAAAATEAAAAAAVADVIAKDAFAFPLPLRLAVINSSALSLSPTLTHCCIRWRGIKNCAKLSAFYTFSSLISDGCCS